MKKVSITLYDCDELSPDAFAKAHQDWAEYQDDPMFPAHLMNLVKEELDERKIAYDADTIDVHYSLGYSQGDGLMFEGTLYPDYGAGRCYKVVVAHNSPHYAHERTASFDWRDADTDGDANTEEGEEGRDYAKFTEEYREICRRVRDEGYNAIEYSRSEELFKDQCEANEWTFEKDGTMRNA